MMIGKYNPVTRQLLLDGSEYDMTLADDRAAVRGQRQDIDEIVAEGMSVYSTGWARAWWGIHPDSLEEYAATMGNQMHYQDHDSSRLLGRTGAASVQSTEDGELHLTQDLAYTTEHGLDLIVHGGDIRASIRATPTENSTYTCSLCDGPWLEGDCDHMPGDRDAEGNVMMVLISDMAHRETSTTHIPASPGTGNEAHEAPMSFMSLPKQLMEHVQTKMSALRGDFCLAVQNAEAEKRVVNTMESELETLRSQLEAKEQDRKRLERASALKTVRDVRRQKGLAIPSGLTAEEFEAELADIYVKDRDVWNLLVLSVPDSKISQVVSGSDPMPDCDMPITAEPGTSAYYSQLARAARAEAAITGEDQKEVLLRLKNQQGER